MTINLVKGGVVDLVKEAGGDLQTVDVVLTWSPNTTDGDDYDPDVVAFVVGDDGNVLDEDWFIRAFGAAGEDHSKAPNGSVIHSGDDRTGGDGETVTVNLSLLPARATKVIFSVPIYKAISRKQNFGSMGDCQIKVINTANGDVLATGDLSFEDSMFTAVNYCALERHANTWALRVIGEGYTKGLEGLCHDHGIPIGKNAYDN